jgi:hypothetical protein
LAEESEAHADLGDLFFMGNMGDIIEGRAGSVGTPTSRDTTTCNGMVWDVLSKRKPAAPFLVGLKLLINRGPRGSGCQHPRTAACAYTALCGDWAGRVAEGLRRIHETTARHVW